MKVQYYYNIGDTVRIQPYSIFSSPTPIEWNDDPYGYGQQYIPEQRFPFEKSIDLYAQYDPICINYYLTAYTSDKQLTASLVSYENRVGTRIEVADFPWISGFAGWLDKDGNQVDVGSYMYLTSTVDLFMSCDFDYSMHFNANGGSGHMEPATATKHVYVDRQTKRAVQEDAAVILPENEFQNEDVRFSAWQIENQQYSPGQSFALEKDTEAYAMWKTAVKYTLNTQCVLVNGDFVFRYFMLKVNQTIGHGIKIRFSKICFIDAESHEELQFPLDAEASTRNIGSFDDYCGALNGIDGSTSTTVSINASKMPCAVIYDLRKPILDVSKYSHLQIWTASNSSLVPYSNMNSFELYVSNNGENWFLADSYSGPVNTGSGQVLYESQDLFVSYIETKVDFDEDGHDEQPDYTLKEYALGNGGYVDIGYKPTLSTCLEMQINTFGQYTPYTYVGFDPMMAQVTDDSDFRMFITDSSHMYFDISNVRYTIVKSLQANAWYEFVCDADQFKLLPNTIGTRSTSSSSSSNRSTSTAFSAKFENVGEIELKDDTIGNLALAASIELSQEQASSNSILFGASEQTYTTVLYSDGTSETFDIQGQLKYGTFTNSTNIVEVIIGSAVTSIDSIAFYNFSRLTSVTIPDSVTSIEGSAFMYSMLASVTIPDSVTKIGRWAFSYCYGLTSVTIGNGVTVIEYRAFSNCSGLMNVTIPDSITSIEDYAFFQCSSLTSVVIPASVTSIERFAFYGCNGLTSVFFKGRTLADVKKLANFPWSINERIIFAEDEDPSIADCQMFVFGRNGEAVDFGLKYLKIYEKANGSKQLKMDMRPAVDAANRSCLVDVLTGNKYYSANSTDIYCSNDASQRLSTAAFNASGEACSEISRQIRVGTAIGKLPQAEKADQFYAGQCTSTSGGTQVAEDTAFSKGTTVCARHADGGIAHVKYTDGTSLHLYICGSITSTTIPNKEDCCCANIGTGVTSIGEDAFNGCSSLTSIMMPDSVVGIGACAFSSCSSLTHATIVLNGGDAQNVKQMLISSGVSPDIHWIIQSR